MKLAMSPESWKSVTKAPSALKSKSLLPPKSFSFQTRSEVIQRESPVKETIILHTCDDGRAYGAFRHQHGAVRLLNPLRQICWCALPAKPSRCRFHPNWKLSDWQYASNQRSVPFQHDWYGATTQLWKLAILSANWADPKRRELQTHYDAQQQEVLCHMDWKARASCQSALI